MFLVHLFLVGICTGSPILAIGHDNSYWSCRVHSLSLSFFHSKNVIFGLREEDSNVETHQNLDVECFDNVLFYTASYTRK